MSIPRPSRKLDASFRRVVSLTIGADAMSIHVEIPEPLATKVTDAAKSQGKSPEDVVLDAVAKTIDPLAQLHEMMAPVYDRMKELGISEDDAVEDFEAEKHAMRRERRAAGK
jgi:hypothetical protein